MNNKTPEVSTAEEQDSPSLRTLRQMRCDRLGIKPWPGTAEIPTPEQLTFLAANLSRNASGDPDQLCAAALDLWAAAAKFVALQKGTNEDRMREQVNKEAIPMPKDIPVFRDGFLRLMLPGKDTGESAELCRRWLRVELGPRLGTQVSITQELVDDAFGNLQRAGMACSDYHHATHRFLEWRRHHNLEHVSAVRREAANKSWILCDEIDKAHKEFPAFEKDCAMGNQPLYQRSFVR